MHVDGGRLPNAVGTIFSLLDVTGVPVELGKHHVAGSGEGQTLERTHTNTHTRYISVSEYPVQPPQKWNNPVRLNEIEFVEILFNSRILSAN